MKNINEDKKHLILVIPKISCHFIYRITATAPKNATGTASTSKQYRKYWIINWQLWHRSW